MQFGTASPLLDVDESRVRVMDLGSGRTVDLAPPRGRHSFRLTESLRESCLVAESRFQCDRRQTLACAQQEFLRPFKAQANEELMYGNAVADAKAAGKIAWRHLTHSGQRS